MKILEDSLPQPKLSVAMVVRDEQDVLAESLDSVQPIAGEIVVLDTGSTDRTPELARERGASVHQQPWANDFAAARNHCLRFATGDWVLWLDAGERLTADSAAEIRRFLDAQADRQTVYGLWVEVPPRDPSASAEQVAQVRLMPANAGLEFAGRVRETLRPSVQSAGLKMAVARGESFAIRGSTTRGEAAKARRDLALATIEAEESGNWPPRLLLAAGQAHSVLGNQDEARELLARCLRDVPPGSAEWLETQYAILTTLDGEPELHDRQMAACLEALEVHPTDLQLLLALGNYLLVRQRLDLAIRAFDAAVRFGTVSPNVWHLCEVREIAAACLSMSLHARQRDDEACQAAETALEAHPHSPRLLRHLFNLYSRQGKTGQAQALTGRMPATLARELTGGAAACLPPDGSGDKRHRFDAGESAVSPPHLDAVKTPAH